MLLDSAYLLLHASPVSPQRGSDTEHALLYNNTGDYGVRVRYAREDATEKYGDVSDTRGTYDGEIRRTCPSEGGRCDGDILSTCPTREGREAGGIRSTCPAREGSGGVLWGL